MASYTRLGNYLLANELTADPFGKIHRGLTLSGSNFDRHVLIRTFSEEVLEAGFGAKLEEANKVASLLAGQRGFGHGYKIEGGRTPFMVCDYVQGRSLAQMLEKAKIEQIPLGVDHALSVLQGVAQSLVQLHAKGVSHGTLSPHSVWVSFEGATQILDAPISSILQSLLPRCHVASASLSRYRGVSGTTALQHDLFSLGAIFYELITLEKLPSPELLSATLAKATLKAAQEDGPVPQEIMGLLKRLLGIEKVFESPAAFSSELERVLYDGDYSPTTFNMAFFMHTLFREENEHDNQAMKADQGADFSPFLEAEPRKGKLFETEGGQSYAKYMVWGGIAVAGILGFFGWKTWDAGKKAEKATQELAMAQRENAEFSARLADINRQEQMALGKKSEAEKQLKEARTAEDKKKAQAKLDEATKQQAELQRQKVETQQQAEKAAARAQSIAQASPAARQAVPPPAVAPPTAQINPAQLPSQLPKNLPGAAAQPTQQQSSTPQQTTAQAAPQLPKSIPASQTAAAPAASQPAADVAETLPTIVRRVAPVPPRVVNKNFLPPSIRDSEIRVSVRVFVDPQGRPLKVIVDKGVEGTFGYNDAAKQAAYDSTYAPATKGGKPANGWITIEYNFGKPR